MAIEPPSNLGNNSVVIGIDKDKSSQWAIRWAVEHLLKGKNSNVVLLHVNSTQAEHAPLYGRAPSDTELQQLFLPYRGFCARKGYDAYEVVLQDSDVTYALVNYIENNSIGTVVVGSSTRNALTRRFKQVDVPTSLIKSAPEFCTVYVISKGKVQSVRCSSTYNALKTSTNLRSSPNNNNFSRFYFANNSTSNNGSTITDNSSMSSYTSSHIPESPTDHDPMMLDTPDDMSCSSSMANYYNARLNTLLGQGQPPTHPHRSNSFDENSRDSYGRESRKSDEMDHSPWYIEGGRTPGRFTRSPSPLSPTFKNQSPSPTARFHDPRAGRGMMMMINHHLPHVKTLLSDGSSINSSCSNVSFESSAYGIDRSSYASSGSRDSCFATEAEIDEEIERLTLAVQKAMELYKLVSEQAATTKHQADEILSREEEHTIEDVTIARQAAELVVELERLKAKAVMDAEILTERIAELETEKRKFAQQRAEIPENNQIVTTTLTTTNTTYQVYTFKEIEVATNYFSASQQVGEGGYGPVYRAVLQDTPVAIKVLRSDVSQGIQQFEKEIEVLRGISHPNMVHLLGACAEHGCLVYEYMDNGSLEDRLFRKNNTPPIPWKARFKIAAEIATALLSLHEAKPKPMVHRDLKPANILLDANYTSKISDVGLARLVPPSVANEMTQYHMTAAAGTFCYIDPEYQQTGLLGTKSDVYSLGVMLLQLITAKPAMALAYNIEESIETGEFPNMLDPAIPDWPVEHALSLAQLALKCCELRKKDRPDLGSVVLPELNRLRNFALSS